VANLSTLCGQLTLFVLPVYAGGHKLDMRVGILGLKLQARLKVWGFESRTDESLFPLVIHCYFTRQFI